MNTVSHPGETLRELLEERGFSQAEAGRRSGIPKGVLNEILSGKRGIGMTSAVRLAKIQLGTAEFWMARQANYNLAQRRKTSGRRR